MVITYYRIETVRVRTNSADTVELSRVLRKKRRESGATLEQISRELNVKRTTVDHWFRSDSCFSVPDREYWIPLKRMIGFTDDSWDSFVLDFTERDGVFEKSQRFYDERGISPTLTSTEADLCVMMRV